MIKARNTREGFTLIEVIAVLIIIGLLVGLVVPTFMRYLKGFRDSYYVELEETVSKSGIAFFTDNREYRPVNLLESKTVKISTLISKGYISNVYDYADNTCDLEESYVVSIKKESDKYVYEACLKCTGDDYESTNTYCSSIWKDSGSIRYEMQKPLSSYNVFVGTSREDLREKLRVGVWVIKYDPITQEEIERIGSVNEVNTSNISVYPNELMAIDLNTIGITNLTYQYDDITEPSKVWVYREDSPPRFVVSFICDDDVACGSTIVTLGSYYGELPKLTREGDVFDGWYTAKMGGKKISSVTEVTESGDHNLYARWEMPKIKISYYNEGALYGSSSVIVLSYYDTLPVSPKKDGYFFEGWFTEEVGGDKVTSTSIVLMGEDHSLYARWIKLANVTFLCDGVPCGNKIVVPSYAYGTLASSPIKPGYNFMGWYTEEVGGTKITDASIVSSLVDHNLYARFVVNEVPPLCTYSGESTIWTTGNRAITYGCADKSGSGGCAAGFSGGTITYSTDMKTATVPSYTIKDLVGNTTVCSAKVVNVYIDKTPPPVPTVAYKYETTSGANYPSDTWTNKSISISYSSVDPGSGIAKYQYTYDGVSIMDVPANWIMSSNIYTGVFVRAVDNLGNTSAFSNGHIVKIDKTAPSCAVSGGSATWTNGSRVVTGTCSDLGGSNCVGNISYTYSTQMNITTAGAAGNGVGGTVKDNAGNTAACAANQTVKIDKTVPSCTVTVSSGTAGGVAGWYKTNVGLSLTRGDTGGSDLAGYGLITSSTATYNSVTTGTQSAETSGTVWYGYVKDNAGNTANCNLTVKKGRELDSIGVVTATTNFKVNPSGSLPAATVRLYYSDGNFQDAQTSSQTGFRPTFYGAHTITASYTHTALSGKAWTRSVNYTTNTTLYVSKTAWVHGVYAALLNRVADAGGLSYQLSVLASAPAYSPANAGNIIKVFITSSEYLNRGLSDRDFIATLYWAALGRAATAAEITAQAATLKPANPGGVTRDQKVNEFVGSVEFINYWNSVPN